MFECLLIEVATGRNTSEVCFYVNGKVLLWILVVEKIVVSNEAVGCTVVL